MAAFCSPRMQSPVDGPVLEVSPQGGSQSARLGCPPLGGMLRQVIHKALGGPTCFVAQYRVTATLFPRLPSSLCPLRNGGGVVGQPQHAQGLRPGDV
jgi:hypothetical protein